MKTSPSASPKTVDEYLASIPEPARTTIKKVRASTRAAAPAETTEGISWRMPMFKYKGMLLRLAAFSNHCSVFPGPAVIATLKGFHTSKGTIQFPVDKPLSTALVKKIVKARIAENEQRKRK